MNINLTNIIEIVDMRHKIFEVDLFFERLKKYNKVFVSIHHIIKIAHLMS